MSADPDDLEMAAAEYVLGWMPESERARFEVRLELDPAARAAVARWADHLEPLGRALPQEKPSEATWEKILAGLGSHGLPGARPHRPAALGRRQPNRGRWGAWAAATSALAAAVAVAVLVTREDVVRPPAELFATAAFTGDPSAPRYEIKLATDRVRLFAAPLGEGPPEGKDHELWVLDENGTPHSLGVLDSRRPAYLEPDTASLGLLQRGVTLAISLEPTGGSTEPGPTGPVLATAALEAPRNS